MVIDDASNGEAMGKMVEANFPKIVWNPCASHCLDLLMEDIGGLPCIKELMEHAFSNVTFFTNKHKALAMF